jgi:multicomponent Na+:H+ antiporter subunit E
MNFATPAPLPSAPNALRRYLARAALMAAAWFGFNGADWNSWIVGGPVVLGAAWVSLRLLPAISWRWSFSGAILFAGFFLRESLRGGWDVARRALAPRLGLAPAIVCYDLRLPAGPARLFFCSAVSLLPGTSVIAIEQSRICVHVLDFSPHVEEELRELERRVAALFGLAPAKQGEASA